MNRFFKIIKITGKILLGLIVILIIVYFLGPKPAKPAFDPPATENLTQLSLSDLEKNIAEVENAVQGIKETCKARIVWADSVRKTKTKVAMVYLHGFGASYAEGAPVNMDLAKQFGCNLYLARLAEHGVETGEKNVNMLNFNAEDYYDSAEKSLAIAKQLGDSVVILAQSGGAALALFLASRHPEVKGLVLYSPAIRVFRKDGQILSEPWGLQLAHALVGTHNDWTFRKPEQRKYWTNHQRFEAIVQFTTFQKYAMTPETFAAVKCPVFMGYYYENEEKQDKVVSIEAMKTMFEQLGTPPQYKRAVNFPNAHAHVLTSPLTTDDWQAVENESVKFIKDILKM
ncbi:MAG: alpha/beta hydrolase [Saprospiraceae bacterium]|nr:alpha/beta hydrolase [Saprospiraceae bacterium]